MKQGQQNSPLSSDKKENPEVIHGGWVLVILKENDAGEASGLCNSGRRFVER